MQSINANGVYAASHDAGGAHSTAPSASEGLVAFCSLQPSTRVFVMSCSLTLRKLLTYTQCTPHAADVFPAMELTAVTFDFVRVDFRLRLATKILLNVTALSLTKVILAIWKPKVHHTYHRSIYWNIFLIN
jgi:hypothetical protein